MKTLTLIVLTIATLVALGVMYMLSQTPSSDGPTDSELFPPVDYNTNVPVTSGTPEPGGTNVNQPISEDFFEVQSQTDEMIRVRDFRKYGTTVEDDVNKGTYYLAGSDFDTAEYTITYIQADSSFTLTIFNEPIGEMRRKAEIDLLTKLGITEPIACYLRYAVLVPASANAVYAGKNLGFSFCQGATPL